ncbi:hypothetical protein G6O69_07610 [Pseudenhygromyxa sp. WMMC2535]|uniref:hypothetical protein n=1 Tax=Pseudenhygromyxa sp. WMMC2535 TaxID=2712867 RepID=UPI001553B2C9|nr:hypothetical protein [Pseudenhygromyxa sp. WMMC2535]NVB37695.1 hypothetical protein [Pseudenhygromyxa sp. WMMC2535]
MATKLGRKQLPPGHKADDFKYIGRPAKDQGDFDEEVGIADMASVNQFENRNSSKYYHAGVLQSQGKWFLYTEWGRISGGKSWSSGAPKSGMDFMFTACTSEAEARALFRKQCRSKNVSRLTQQEVGGKTIWAAKVDSKGKAKDAYIVQGLATRERGLPDAYSIKDDSGLEDKKAAAAAKKKAAKKTASKRKPKPGKNYQPQVLALANDLVGGTREYARAASAATGIIPTMKSITEVRDELLPLAMERIADISKRNPQRKRESQDSWEQRLLGEQLEDDKLIALSKLVAALVPRVIPLRGSSRQRAVATILSSANVLAIQNDLDAFASALSNEDFSLAEDESEREVIDPGKLLNAELTWIDPSSTKGKWLAAVYGAMSNNRHSYMRGKLVIKNIFEVRRPDRDEKFVAAVETVAKSRKGKYAETARLQPSKRSDLVDISDYARQANVFLGIHGTRAVNIHPILASNLRLPRSLPGAQITGAAFGHGIYFATDWRKSYGYTGHGNSYWCSGGNIRNRGFFMFLNDVIMGDAYMTRSCGSWSAPPSGKDSVAAYDKYVSSLANDEHIIFNPNYQRIRYLVEGEIK